MPTSIDFSTGFYLLSYFTKKPPQLKGAINARFLSFIHTHKLSSNILVKDNEVNIRQYAKYLLKEGSTSDKRELLGNLRSQLSYKDKKITMIAE